MSEENFRIKVENYIVTHDEKITELVQKLSEVSIKASAKAVIVPEGKGIFWTDKIKALEKNWNLHIQSESRIHDDQKKQFSELRKDLYTVLQARNWNSEVIYDNREVLREFIDFHWTLETQGQTHEKDLTWDEKYDKHAELSKKLSGESKVKFLCDDCILPFPCKHTMTREKQRRLGLNGYECGYFKKRDDSKPKTFEVKHFRERDFTVFESLYPNFKVVWKEDLEKIKLYNNRDEQRMEYSNQYLINEVLEKYLSEEEK